MAPAAPPGASRTLVTLIDGDCALCSAYARLILLSRLRSLHRDTRIWRSEYTLLCVQ